MSDEGEKTCPICAEEMDLTDQQLKPCKCGYEICVWCWHHIMEMAEKDDTDGRCPACRNPYDKEKIVGTASKCERLVAEISMEKKKSHKAKSKTSEGRKQLTSVRVIQRNLVYIVGLPLNLADEDLLQRKEYFGQYGKVLKVSISRTSAGTIQQFANSTCSVYITYSKEEEAVRCIQSIHGFTLEGRTLRACFGTTKYCHAWLRNVPCTNPDCLYLHEIGSQEESFSKDENETISAYSRVQQITGLANSGQRYSGSVLPPPADDYCINSPATAGKPIAKSTPNNLVSSAKVSPPASSAGRTGVLPAAASWGSRGSNCQSSVGGMVCSNELAKQKHDAVNGSPAFSASVSSFAHASVQSSNPGKVILNDDIHPKEHTNKLKPPETKNQLATDLHSKLLVDSHTPLAVHTTSMATSGQPPSLPISMEDSKITFVKEQSNIVGTEKERVLATHEKNKKLCHEAISVGLDMPNSSQNSRVSRPNGLSLDCFLDPRDHALQQSSNAKLQQMTSPSSKAPKSIVGASVLRSDSQSSALLTSEKEDDFEIQRLSDAIVTQTSLPSSSHSFNLFNHLRGPLHHHSDGGGAVSYTVNPVVNKKDEEHLAAVSSNGVVNNQVQSTIGIGHSYGFSNGICGNQMGLSDNGMVDNQVQSTIGIGHSNVFPNGIYGNQTGTSDIRAANIALNSGEDVMESSIISNILSLDLDAWDDSLTSPQNLVKLLGENGRHQGPSNLSSSWKAQNSNQSRFSFARQEESRSHSFDVEPSVNSSTNPHFFSPASIQHREPYLDRLGNGYGMPQCNAEQYNGFGSSQSLLSNNKLSGSRSQISAPPGFSGPSRLPPPGFSSHGRSDPTFEVNSGNHFLENSSSLRNPYQAAPSTNSNSISDMEFIDPAILAVGKGRPPNNLGNSNTDLGPNFSSQTSTFENDSRLQMLMQRSLQPQQNYRYAEIGESYSHNNAAYGFSSRHVEPPSQISGLSSFSQFAHQPRNTMSNGHWDSWPEVVAGNNMGIAELLRNDRLGFNKHYSGYEESKFQMPGSGDVYHRTFGM